MTFKYKKELTLIGVTALLCLSIFAYIKVAFFNDKKIDEPIKNVIKYYNNDVDVQKLAQATTKVVPTTLNLVTDVASLQKEEEVLKKEETEKGEFPYSVAPTFEDDGSIIYDGMTLTELTNKLNLSLNDYMTNTGYFFAKFTKDTGMDPYLAVSIVLLETGCKWKCSSLTTKCNNIGGLKGGESCDGKSYRRYDSLAEGIEGYLNIIYKNYYLEGLTTPELMNSKYAASSQWATKVNKYIEEVKSK